MSLYDELASGRSPVYISDDFDGRDNPSLKGYESLILQQIPAGPIPSLAGTRLRYCAAGTNQPVEVRIISATRLAGVSIQLQLDAGIEGVDGTDGVICWSFAE